MGAANSTPGHPRLTVGSFTWFVLTLQQGSARKPCPFTIGQQAFNGLNPISVCPDSVQVCVETATPMEVRATIKAMTKAVSERILKNKQFRRNMTRVKALGAKRL